MDGDNKMFPLALSVVGVENYDNWSWSLGLLVQDLQISDSSTWCIMTDKQKVVFINLLSINYLC